jgi:hypothetical protein
MDGTLGEEDSQIGLFCNACCVQNERWKRKSPVHLGIATIRVRTRQQLPERPVPWTGQVIDLWGRGASVGRNLQATTRALRIRQILDYYYLFGLSGSKENGGHKRLLTLEQRSVPEIQSGHPHYTRSSGNPCTPQ